MNFDLANEHRLLEKSVREWAGREVAPRIRELDRAHRFDRGIFPQMAELGLLGLGHGRDLPAGRVGHAAGGGDAGRSDGRPGARGQEERAGAPA